MRYLIYKNCTAEEFVQLKTRLNILTKNILSSYSQKLQTVNREDDSDTLILNFDIFCKSPFKENIAIIFEDVEKKKTFKIVILKSFDEEGYRYSLKKTLYEGVTLDFVEENYLK